LGLSEEGNPYAAQPTLKCFVTNVVRCNPPSNRAPTGAEIANCLPFLWQEIDLLQPQILVPIGNVAARALFPRLLGEPAAPITHMHAQVLSGDGMSIVPMRHPARISNRDLERFCSVMHPLLQGLPHP
jgi:DNA polymerase